MVTGEEEPPGSAEPRGSRFTRREFVAGGASALVVVGAAGYLGLSGRAAQAAQPGPPPPLRFFDEQEARVITALAERIFPADDQSPGATDLWVVHYIDGQMAGAWGKGQGMYAAAPFVKPTDTGHGWQYDLTPAQTYQKALPALADYCARKYARSYDQLSAAQQDEVMAALARGKVETFTEPSAAEFFAFFREHVLEGLFSDPLYGGNQGMLGWQWLGFPGNPMAYNEPYENYIDNWNASYQVAPKSIQS